MAVERPAPLGVLVGVAVGVSAALVVSQGCNRVGEGAFRGETGSIDSPYRQWLLMLVSGLRPG